MIVTLAIFARNSIVDIRQASEYVSPKGCQKILGYLPGSPWLLIS